ncbi:MAG: hypothetical protein J1E01_08110 [Acetatifactor sp.]|nr:hypothetical protein [Acetatifactor sp.]
MNRKLKLYSISAFSMFTALMLVVFILMLKLGTETPGFGIMVYVIIGAAAVVASSVFTLLTVIDGGMYDDYQIGCMDRISVITRTVAKVLIPLIAIIGIVLDSVGFIVCVGMLAAWVLLLTNATVAVVIGHRK